MANDIFGYNKQTATGGVMGPNFVTVTIGSASNIHLVQTVNLTYQRTVQPVYEIGSGSVWMQPGPASGSLTLSRVVGQSGAFDPIVQPKGQPCGTVDITISGDGAECGGATLGSVKCKQCMPMQVGLTVAVGTATVTDNVVYMVGSVEK